MMRNGFEPAEQAGLDGVVAAAENATHDHAVDVRRARRAWRWILTTMIPDILRRLGANALANQFAAIDDIDDVNDALRSLATAAASHQPPSPGPMPPPVGDAPPVDSIENKRAALKRACARRVAAHLMLRSGIEPLFGACLAADVIPKPTRRLAAVAIALLFRAAVWSRWTSPADSVIDVAINGNEAQRRNRERQIMQSMRLDVDQLGSQAVSVLNLMAGEA